MFFDIIIDVIPLVNLFLMSHYLTKMQLLTKNLGFVIPLREIFFNVTEGAVHSSVCMMTTSKTDHLGNRPCFYIFESFSILLLKVHFLQKLSPSCNFKFFTNLNFQTVVKKYLNNMLQYIFDLNAIRQ